MIVSWEWLRQYVDLAVSVEELCARLTAAGFNHEGTQAVGDDLAIEFEITSNRPDCLGHIGLAREAAAVTGGSLRLPPAEPRAAGPSCAELTSVEVECPDLCPRYIARVIRGVKVRPSPAWMQRRLATCGISSINNIVDITNYVMLEISQPLHAFDYDRLFEHRIVVRRAKRGEQIVAINQRTYDLTPDMCVIADGLRPVAIAGVMGGLETEISDKTTNVLIESAQFDPLSVRRTSRALGLSSPSSYRFERGVDPAGVEWASRRCCELILELAGGELAEGYVGLYPELPPRPAIRLRLNQIERILGIHVPKERVVDILRRLQLDVREEDERSVVAVPPTWRADLTREIDLVEEVGRIEGYDRVSENEPVPAVCAPLGEQERVLRRVRQALSSLGLHEAYTQSFVEERNLNLIRPWTGEAPLRVNHPSRRQENCLRQSLLPSLLLARRLNESRGNEDLNLFELARIYLPRPDQPLPDEPLMLGVVADLPLENARAALEAVLDWLHVADKPRFELVDLDGFEAGQCARIWFGDALAGVIGTISQSVVDALDLRRPCGTLELRIDDLAARARLVPRFEPFSAYPAVSRDFSFIVDENVTWAAVEQVVRAEAGDLLEEVELREVYRGAPVPRGQKSVHFRVVFRSRERTLTGEEVDAIQNRIVSRMSQELGARLRA